jgi:hypothetical protein
LDFGGSLPIKNNDFESFLWINNECSFESGVVSSEVSFSTSSNGILTESNLSKIGLAYL